MRVASPEFTDLSTPKLPMGTRNVVITGPMGAGKSTVGRLVAEGLQLPFVDLDAVIEARLGMTIAEIFAERGEDGFREIERGILREAARLSGTVVATGGGAVLHDDAFSE